MGYLLRSIFRCTVFLLCIGVGRLSAAQSVLYVSNFGANTVTRYDAATGSFLGASVESGPEAKGLNGLALAEDGSILISGQLTNNVVRYGPGGAPITLFDPANSASLNSPQGVLLRPDGLLYVLSSADDRIVRFNASTGAFVDTFANLGASGHIGPIDLKVGPDGNLYVTGFDSGVIVRVEGVSGTVLGTIPGPAGIGFGAAAFGPDGLLYMGGTDLATFTGGVYRFDPAVNNITPFVGFGSGGLQSPGGIAFGPSGDLLVANVVVDAAFNDAGSTILRYDGVTGAPLGTLVGPNSGLNLPFFMEVGVASAVPEPSAVVMLSAGVAVLSALRIYRRHRG